MNRIPKVAVLIESSRSYGRGLIAGVARYSRMHGPWLMYFEPRGSDVAPPAWLSQWDGDGILARIDDQRMADAILATELPALDLRGRLPDLGLPFIGADNKEVTRLAFEHLRERGLTQFGFCGVPAGEMRTLDLRRMQFARQCDEAGFECAEYARRPVAGGGIAADAVVSSGIPAVDFGAQDWETEQSALAEWVLSLPKPIGIMACHDPRAYQLIDACRRAGVSVPDEVAVVGVDNDPVLCTMSNPPLTSIDTGGERIGFEAAAVLARLMQGESVPDKPVLVSPRMLYPRNSSDMLAIEDADIAEAVRFIRDHACEGIRVVDVVRHVSLSRSVFERRFRQMLARTPKAELLRVQIARATQLLADTDLPLTAIARQSGFSTEKYFSDAFLRETQLRPSAWRRRIRPE